MRTPPLFMIDCTDGEQLGKLSVSLNEVADWLNFLATPHYRATIVSAEQASDSVTIYFHGNEGLYLYLERLFTESLFPMAS